MKSNRRLNLGRILTFALCLGTLSTAPGQAPTPTPEATQFEVIVMNGAGREKQLPSINGVVPMVMVRPNQAVPITLQFSPEKAGMPVTAMPLDGGSTNRDNLVILPTGKVIFTFQPSPTPGRYRMMLDTPVGQHLLEFYVVDPNNPPQNQRP
jgi:hypothetical protein